jgi:hypothetical protein
MKIPWPRPSRVLVVAGLSVLLTACVARSQTPGVTESEILIGSCSALEGPSHFLGTETVAGANAYFGMINDGGGVDGRKLKLIAYDDSYDPQNQVCFDRLMSQKSSARLLRGNSGREIRSLAETKIPLVGLFTGAQPFTLRCAIGSSMFAHPTLTRRANRSMACTRSATKRLA